MNQQRDSFSGISLLLLGMLFLRIDTGLAQNSTFAWPEGKKTAISLSFDDARAGQATTGIPVLNEYGVKATFYVVPSAVKGQLDNWKKAVATGQEIGNHSVNHPCTGNFPWSRAKALEDYTQETMRAELTEANTQIFNLLGVKCETFAYPCGNTFVGRGVNTKSYVPVVADLFATGRGWLDEGPNSPEFCDPAQLTGMAMDEKDFEQVLPLIEQAKANGQWLILAGHEMGEKGPQTTRISMLRKLIEYAQDPQNEIWLAPVGTVNRYVLTARSGKSPAPDRGSLVRPDERGIISLHAQTGVATGPAIKFMPEWKAFGWFTGDDKVTWEVEVPQEGSYDVLMEWSVSDEEAGKIFLFETGGRDITGTVGKSGSWETFKETKIGEVRIGPGERRMVFRSATAFKNGALLDLREIKLVPNKKAL